ncbi:MAG: hypothetical protein AAF843_01195 [Bacteroidota bacterium]
MKFIKISAAALFIFSALGIYAQENRSGIKGGLNASNLYIDD